MAFKQIGKLGESHGGPILQSRVLANSITVTEMDSMKLVSGALTLGTTGALVFGHVIGIRTDAGVGLETSGVAGAQTGSFAGSYLTASDNFTVAKVRATCDISKNSLYSAEEDAAIGTTTGSNLAGYTQDLVDEDTLDESTAVQTTGQYMGHGVDPSTPAQAIVNIYESQVL
jgi:hypothetical protein